MSITFDERYRAISSRDARFDGQFVTVVHTTGIYCRPSCPARTPKPENVSFLPTSAAAHEAGFRACKRCLPEAAPGSPDWDLRGDAAGRAMRMIADGVVEREGVAGLAAHLGYSSRHLGRLLTEQLGAGPLALARAQRAHTARMLLVGTELSVADVAFSAGFRSIRQFNDTIREVFGLTPTDLRARRTRIGVTEPGRIDLMLAYRAPFDPAGVFAWMSQRVLVGMEAGDQTGFERTLRMPGGPVWFRVEPASDDRLRLSVRLTALPDLAGVVARVRRLFDLDADPVAIDAALSAFPALAGQVSRIPGIRVPGTADPHEMLIRAMVGQQISVAAARTHLARLVAELGDDTAVAGDGGPGKLFPTMAAIAEHGAEVLRGPAARIRAITEAASRLADGSLTLSSGDDSLDLRERLLALRGVGPWTADYVRMRVVGDPDVFLPGDVAVRQGAGRLGLPTEPAPLSAWAATTSPWQSYVTAHLWRAIAEPEISKPATEPRVPEASTSDTQTTRPTQTTQPTQTTAETDAAGAAEGRMR